MIAEVIVDLSNESVESLLAIKLLKDFALN